MFHSFSSTSIVISNGLDQIFARSASDFEIIENANYLVDR